MQTTLKIGDQVEVLPASRQQLGIHDTAEHHDQWTGVVRQVTALCPHSSDVCLDERVWIHARRLRKVG